MHSLHLRPVINAWGTATPYGVSRSPAQVCTAVAEALEKYYVMSELQEACAARLTAWSGAEAACVTHCTAAAITLATGGCMAGSDPRRVAQLPDVAGLPHQVLLLRQHDVSYGQRLTQAIRLAGAVPVLCASVGELEQRLPGGGIACVFAVESHLAHGSGADQTRALVSACRDRVPLVLDAAAQDRRVRELVRCGADLVLLSGQKYLASPTAGIVLGTRGAVASVDAQHAGIGRGMKPSKEALAGVIAAIDARMTEEPGQRGEVEREKVRALLGRASTWTGVQARVERDPVGNDTERIWLKIDGAVAKVDAAQLARRLLQGEVAIATAPHRLAQGEVGLELSGITLDEVDVLCREIARTLAAG